MRVSNNVLLETQCGARHTASHHTSQCGARQCASHHTADTAFVRSGVFFIESATAVLTDVYCVGEIDVIDVQVLNGALLQQTFVVEFTVHNQMCDDCHRVEAKDYWRSCVQLRQKVCTDARYFPRQSV